MCTHVSVAAVSGSPRHSLCRTIGAEADKLLSCMAHETLVAAWQDATAAAHGSKVLTAEDKDAGLGSVFRRDDERLAKMRDQVR